MSALAWVPLSDAAAAKLAEIAQTEGVAIEELAGRVLTAFANKSSKKGNQPATVEKNTPHDLLLKLEQSIQRHWTEHPGQRTGTENIIVASLVLIREVNNGGFDQFFRNERRWAGFAPDAMLHIGRKDAARIAKRALRAAGSWSSLEEFEQKLNAYSAKRDDILNECDIAFYQLTGLEESLLAYARNHPNGLLRR
jgi:hypothetical protein